MALSLPDGPALTSIVAPIHNQADHLHDLVKDYRAAFSRLPGSYELILVTNACRDESPAIARELASAHDEVVHVDIREAGWGRAVKAGLTVAGGDMLCYTNSARTSAEILTLMLAYARAYPKVVLKANRRIRESRRRRLGSLLYNLECRALFNLSVWDINGTPKIFPRSFDKLLHLRSDDDLIDVEFNAVCKEEGYPVVEIPLLSTKRYGGYSTTNYRSAVRMYWGVFVLARGWTQQTAEQHAEA